MLLHIPEVSKQKGPITAGGKYTLAGMNTEETVDVPVERLSWLLDEIEHRLATAMACNTASHADFEAQLLMTCWLQISIEYGKVIRTLILNDLEASVGPTERALWELWIEWRYLKTTADPRTAAAKVILTAKVEALELGEKHPEFRFEVVERLRGDIADLAATYPQAYDEVCAQRKGRRFHWSGESYSNMERTLVADSAMYKLLSWDAHGTLAMIRNVRLKRDGDRLTAEFGRSDADPMTDPARIAWSVGGVLYYMFYDWADLMQLPPIIMPSA